ncbi:MAG: HEAT repeat domain-containing protein [Desulfamplus sp.]|nr:HEAT repeat domain-containing protein [Desulfamplus sp.]
MLPILIYLWLFLIFYCITNSTLASGAINILIFLSIFYLLYPLAFIYEPIPIDKMLNHSDYKIRVEGLKTLCKSKNGESIWSYPQSIERVMMQGDIVEKYWLANAFGAAKNSKALPYIEQLIDDKSINVQCAAIGAMANISISLSGDEKRVFVKKSASIFKYIIANTNYWYVQKRAYIALKRVSET